MKKKTTLALVTGTAFAAAFAMSPVASAADLNESPFAMIKLDSGYQLAAAEKKTDGKCGEAKCGGDKKAEKPMDDKKKDGSCGGDKKKDASCGANK